MMKQVLHIVLSVLLLSTTTGFTVKQHYCMGELQYASINVWALPCCGEDAAMASGCCKDVYSHHQLEEDFPDLPSFGITTPVQMLVYPPLVKAKIKAQEVSQLSLYEHYRPPLIYEDVCVRIQSFLI